MRPPGYDTLSLGPARYELCPKRGAELSATVTFRLAGVAKPVEGTFYLRSQSARGAAAAPVLYCATSKALVREGRARSYKVALSAEPKNGPFEFRLLSDDVSPGGFAAMDLKVDAGVFSDRAGSIGGMTYAIVWKRIPRLQAARK
jgi:hypothetical protein